MSALRNRLLSTGRIIGRRGAFLFFLAILDFAYGYSLWSASAAQARTVDLLLPWKTWAILWLIAGMVCLTGVPMRKDLFQYTFSAGFKTAWAMLYVELWVARGVPEAWVGAVIWLAFAATVFLISGWPESVTDTVVTTTMTTTTQTDILPGTSPPGDSGEH